MDSPGAADAAPAGLVSLCDLDASRGVSHIFIDTANITSCDVSLAVPEALISDDRAVAGTKDNDTLCSSARSSCGDEGGEKDSDSAVTDVPPVSLNCYIEYDLCATPTCLGTACAEFSGPKSKNNFLKGCKWSPDGSCLLTSSDDNKLRLFALPECFYTGDYLSQLTTSEMLTLLHAAEGGTVYDFSWYPLMTSTDAASCCFASTSSGAPIHLWDGYGNGLRASYRAINHLDELSPACSLAFSLDGVRLYAGFDRMIRIFDIDRPGRQVEDRPTCVKGRAERQPGIISCIAMSPTDHLYAAGSYSRSVAVYSEADGQASFVLYGHEGGVTHLQFSPDGLHLFSGARKDNEILCWDLRAPGEVLFTATRRADTNQRLYFDIGASGRYLFTGNSDGNVSIFDTHQMTATSAELADPGCTATPLEEQHLVPQQEFAAHRSCTNGISLHPTIPLLATSSGQRTFDISYLSDSEDEAEAPRASCQQPCDVSNEVRLWWIGRR